MKRKTYQRFKKMVKPYIKTIILVTILALIIDVCELARPYLVQQVLDNYLSKRTFIYGSISISFIALIYVILVVTGNIIDYVTRIITTSMSENVVYDLRNQLFTYIEKANISFHNKTPSGKLFVRVTSDTEDVYALFNEVILSRSKWFVGSSNIKKFPASNCIFDNIHLAFSPPDKTGTFLNTSSPEKSILPKNPLRIVSSSI